MVASLDACLFMLSLAATRRVSAAAAGKRKPEREKSRVQMYGDSHVVVFLCSRYSVSSCCVL